MGLVDEEISQPRSRGNMRLRWEINGASRLAVVNARDVLRRMETDRDFGVTFLNEKKRKKRTSNKKKSLQQQHRAEMHTNREANCMT